MHRRLKDSDEPPYKPLGPKTVVKVLLIIFTCLGFSCMVVAHMAFGDDYTEAYQNRYILYFATHLIGMLESIIILAIFLAQLDLACGARRVFEIANVVMSFGLSILCGISAGLMFYYADKLYNNRLYDTDTEYWKWYTDHLLVAISVGILNSILFLIDATLHANAFR
ncbi:uncharacterized protein LOC116303975 [Actinia tenebrosa]|uniref:Uncharacterized protein LOC116303975 n=1 Tax=Actinia tenebrosa TaxID=6105 RepID=A0A6P8ITF6_ACTTE|nr:uncharacterized protein LOC116303975 [Actinia tenebrosa]